MFGFSPLKLLVLVVIIAVIWYGFKALGKKRKSIKPDPGSPAVDMVKCAVCGEYVSSDSKDCGKDRCPYLG